MRNIDNKARFHLSKAFLGVAKRYVVRWATMLGNVGGKHAVVVITAPREIGRVICGNC